MRVGSDVVSPVSPDPPPVHLNIDPESACLAGGRSEETLPGLHFTLPIIVSPPSLRSEEIVSTIWIGNQIFTVINLIRYFLLKK